MPAIPQIPSRPTLCACTRIPRPSQVSPRPADVPPPGQGPHRVWQTSRRSAIATPVDAGRSLGGRATGRHRHTLRLLHPQESPTVRRRPDASDLETIPGGLLGATVTSPLSPSRPARRRGCVCRERRSAAWSIIANARCQYGRIGEAIGDPQMSNLCIGIGGSVRGDTPTSVAPASSPLGDSR